MRVRTGVFLGLVLSLALTPIAFGASTCDFTHDANCRRVDFSYHVSLTGSVSGQSLLPAQWKAAVDQTLRIDKTWGAKGNTDGSLTFAGMLNKEDLFAQVTGSGEYHSQSKPPSDLSWTYAQDTGMIQSVLGAVTLQQFPGGFPIALPYSIPFCNVYVTTGIGGQIKTTGTRDASPLTEYVYQLTQQAGAAIDPHFFEQASAPAAGATPQTHQFILDWVRKQPLPQGTTESASLRLLVEWSLSIDWTPPKAHDSDCAECGSVIGAHEQSLGQVVPVAGTPFQLIYQSDRMPGRLGSTSPWTALKQFLGGWTLSVHHAYDASTKVLYLGDGTRRSGNAVAPVATASGGFLIPGQDENLIYEFDKNGRHARTLDEFTGTAWYTFGYDSLGRLTGITDESGNQTAIERNGDLPAAIVGPYLHRTTLVAGPNGYLARVQGPDGAVIAATYDAGGLMSTFTDPRGNAHQFTFSADGRLIRDQDPAGGYTALARSTQGTGYTVTLSTASGRTTVYSVTGADDAQNLQSQFPDGSGAQGSKTGEFFSQVREPAGMTTTLNWLSDPRWGVEEATPKGVTWTTPTGLAAAMTLDRSVDLASPSNPLSMTGLHETLSINGRNYLTGYTAASGTLTGTSPVGRKGTATLDAHGRVVARTFGNLAPAAYSYDSHGRLSGLTTGDGDQQRGESYTYGADGMPARWTDALGQVTKMEYDDAGRLVRLTRPDGGVVGLAYDASGNLASFTPPGAAAHTFQYTALDQPASYTPPALAGAAPPLAFTWNSDRELAGITQPDGGNVTLTRDSKGRLIKLDFPTGSESYTYDDNTGQLSAIADAAGNSLAYTYDGPLPLSETWDGAVAGSVQRAYNQNFQLAGIAITGAEPVSLSYDDDGYLVQAGDLALTRDSATGLIAGTVLDQVSDVRSYNAFGELTGYRAGGPAGTAMDVRLVRDKLGRITQRTETVNGTTSVWSYQYDAAGRLTGVNKDGTATSYSYDANGNRLRVSDTSGASDATYDAQDRLTARDGASYQYTAQGDLARKISGNRTTQYEYDARGSLRRVLQPDGKEIRYVIDGHRRRIGKLVDGTLVQGLLYLGPHPVAELDGQGNLVSQFVYGGDAGAPAYLVKNGNRYRIVADPLGSPRLVVNLATGEIAQRMDYDAFGRVVMDSSPGFQPFGFAGGLYDADTGLVRFGARDYDAEAGRWTAKDPRGFGGGDPNLYAYNGNDPVNRSDRAGTDSAIDRGTGVSPVSSLFPADAGQPDGSQGATPDASGPPDPLAPLTGPPDPLAPLTSPPDPLAPLVVPAGTAGGFWGSVKESMVWAAEQANRFAKDAAKKAASAPCPPERSQVPGPPPKIPVIRGKRGPGRL